MANIITGLRIVCALVLLACPTFSGLFYALYILGGISDVLDGFAARRFGTETTLGAQLDTIADIVFTAVVMIKVVRAISIPAWLLVWIVCIAVIKCISIISGFVLHKRFVSEHTVLNKLCGVLLFAIPLCIGTLPWQPVAILMLLTCVTATIAAIQEGLYIRTEKGDIMEVTGTVISASRQWWLKVNTKPIRMGAMDGATFPYIIRIKYTVDGTDFIKKQWIGAGKPVPEIGSPVRLSYDESKHSKAKVL